MQIQHQGVVIDHGKVKKLKMKTIEMIETVEVGKVGKIKKMKKLLLISKMKLFVKMLGS